MPNGSAGIKIKIMLLPLAVHVEALDRLCSGIGVVAYRYAILGPGSFISKPYALSSASICFALCHTIKTR